MSYRHKQRNHWVRSRWHLMLSMIVLFILGYIAYALLVMETGAVIIDLIVPVIFLLGACFVWLTARLSLQTALDVMRISVLERDNATDVLTGVFNRRYLDNRLSEEVASARRYGLPLSVMMIDADHFKRINDSYGHQAGDQVLAILAKVIGNELRQSDLLARYGGEEFLVIVPNTDLPGTLILAERVRCRVRSHAFDLISEATAVRVIPVTISIGLASLGDGVESPEGLVQAAGQNLYRAKQTGRNRVVADKRAVPL